MHEDLIRTELLAIRYRQGDSDAMGEMVSIWQNPLYYYVRRLVRDEEEALDIAQDVWLRVIREFRKLRRPAAFPAWIFKIARNVTYSHLRKGGRIEMTADDEVLRQVTYEENADPLAEFSAEDIHCALEKLTVAHRECLTLHFIEGFSLLEVSDIVGGVPLGTVKSRLYHAKRALRRILEQEGDRHE